MDQVGADHASFSIQFQLYTHPQSFDNVDPVQMITPTQYAVLSTVVQRLQSDGAKYT